MNLVELFIKWMCFLFHSSFLSVFYQVQNFPLECLEAALEQAADHDSKEAAFSGETKSLGFLEAGFYEA